MAAMAAAKLHEKLEAGLADRWPSDSVGRPVDAVASEPAFAFASRATGELLLSLARTQGTVHPYNDDSDSTHI